MLQVAMIQVVLFHCLQEEILQFSLFYLPRQLQLHQKEKNICLLEFQTLQDEYFFHQDI